MIVLIIIVLTAALVLVLTVLMALFMMSNKSTRHIWAEIKYEIVYNALGAKALLEDMIMRDKNDKIELSKASGKVALVTGGARGIGVQVVKKLMECDAHVIVGCRNVTAAEKLLKTIREQGITTGDLIAFELDLSSIESVKLFAAIVKQKYSKINILINNAGKMFGPYLESVDGYESQFATNYLGHFLLTHLLLPEIKAAGEVKNKSRIINVSSCAHEVGKINFDDINYKKEYISSLAYAQSKLAQVLFSNHLNNLMKEDGALTSVYSVHPGIVNTELFDDTYLKTFCPFVPLLLFKTPLQGAMSILYAALSHQVETIGGSYISNCQIIPTCERAYSTNLQKEMFEFTNDLLDIKEFGKQ